MGVILFLRELRFAVLFLLVFLTKDAAMQEFFDMELGSGHDNPKKEFRIMVCTNL